MPNSAATRFPACRLTRRDFLSRSTAVAAVAGMGMPAMLPARGAGGAVIRIGLVGCGGRGTGAALQAVAADPAVRIVALGDAFEDQLAASAGILARDARGRFDCPRARRFGGGDAYRRVLDSGVDAVLIAAPPHLRPLHVAAAVAAGVHVFCETPAAINVAGVAEVMEAFAAARRRGLTIASGLHARRDGRLAALVSRVHSGAIGRVDAVEVHAAIDKPWRVPASPAHAPAEGRLRNWITSPSLSGGHFVERHVHAIDRALWVLGDRAPEVAEPLAVGTVNGVAVRYRFPDGAEIVASTRPATAAVEMAPEVAVGSRGTCELEMSANGHRFQATMDAFVAAIRSAEIMDDSASLTRGTLVAIMGRLAAARGRPVGWEELSRETTPLSQFAKSAPA